MWTQVLWTRSIPAWTLAMARSWAWPAHRSQFGPQVSVGWQVSRRYWASLKNANRGKPPGSPLMNGFICVFFVNTNNNWIQSTHLRLEDKWVLPCTASGWQLNFFFQGWIWTQSHCFWLPFSHDHILSVLVCKQKSGTICKLRRSDCSNNSSHNKISIWIRNVALQKH